LRVDLSAARHSLPPELTVICSLLERFTPTETAIKLGITRSSLYRRMREIADYFEERDLNEYLVTTAGASN